VRKGPQAEAFPRRGGMGKDLVGCTNLPMGSTDIESGNSPAANPSRKSIADPVTVMD
jgi:hypothetical protein